MTVQQYLNYIVNDIHRTIVATVDDKGLPVTCAIDISDSLLVTKYHLYVDSCALGVGAHSENIKEVGDFLNFVLGEV